MYYIVTKDNVHQLTIWYRGDFSMLREVVQYIMDGSIDPAVFYIILEDKKEMPLPSFAEIFHIKRRESLKERLA